MDDIKRGYREAEETAKETWRKADGDESLEDKVGNLGDDVRKHLGNAGDDIRRAGDGIRRKVEDLTDDERVLADETIQPATRR